MADGAVHQLQAGLNGPLADLLDLLAVAHALHMGVCAELQIDLVGVIDQLLRVKLADQAGQVAAHLMGEAQLAVRKGAGAGKTGGDVAVGLAVHAVAHLGLGAVALLHGLALFKDGDLLLAALAQQLQRGEDAGRAGTDDDQVVLHGNLLLNGPAGQK